MKKYKNAKKTRAQQSSFPFEKIFHTVSTIMNKYVVDFQNHRENISIIRVWKAFSSPSENG